MASDQLSLRCELVGHEEDVRGVLASDVGLITSSRDKTVRVWVESGDKEYTLMHTLVGHTNYVGPLAYIPAGLFPDLPNGAIVSGSRDTSVIVWDPVLATPLLTLRGHTYQVSAVAWVATGEIVSGALDKTVRVWQGDKCIKVLEGHEAAVLCVLALPDGDLLSGSGDTTIRRWSLAQGRCTQTIRGHGDTVRAMALLPGLGFVSGSHDASVRVWTLEGQQLAELVGHTALIYAVAATQQGRIASGSEDNTARIWMPSGECLQVLDHPGCVWDVAYLPNGDLVSACADAVARVWTADAARKADAEKVEAFDAVMSSRKAEAEAAAATAQAGALPENLKVEEPFALLERGKRDGETKIVREPDGGAAVYAWSDTKFEWEKVGTVVGGGQGGSGGGGGKKSFNGAEWDFVFDVDVEDGAPARKLATNRGENPYIAADRFLAEEELPMYFREQIVQFILQNTGQAGAAPSVNDMPITGGGFDPFTGSGASYVPPPASQQRPPTYTAPPTPMDITGGFVDPFTGVGASHPMPASYNAYLQDQTTKGAVRPGLKHVPATSFMLFDNVPPADALGRKLREFNEAVKGQPDAAVLALSEAEVAQGGALDGLLARLQAATSAGSSGAFTPEQLQLMDRLLGWPREYLFPVLDVLRVALLDSAAATRMAEAANAATDTATGGLGGALAAAAREPALPQNQQTALRVLCNCFKSDALRAWVTANRSQLLDSFAPAWASANKNVRLSAATFMLNCAVTLGGKPGADGGESKLQLASGLVEVLAGSSGLEDPDTTFRALLAVGTLAQHDPEVSGVLRELALHEMAQTILPLPGLQAKVADAASDVLSVLKA